MDIHTYNFSKCFNKKSNTNLRDIVSVKDFEDIENIVSWLIDKGFIMYCASKIKKIHYREDPNPPSIIPGSFHLDFAYDLGEDIKKFVLVSISNNVHISNKTQWNAYIDDGLPIRLGKGDNFKDLEELIYNLPCLNVGTDNMFIMLNNMI